MVHSSMLFRRGWLDFALLLGVQSHFWNHCALKLWFTIIQKCPQTLSLSSAGATNYVFCVHRGPTVWVGLCTKDLLWPCIHFGRSAVAAAAADMRSVGDGFGNITSNKISFSIFLHVENSTICQQKPNGRQFNELSFIHTLFLLMPDVHGFFFTSQ